MKKFDQICEEIRAAEKSATRHKAKDEYDAIFEIFGSALRDFHAGIITEEQKNKARERERAALEAYKREQDKNTADKIRAEILKENAAHAFYNDYIGIICDIWNKYAGKAHGEKTADKIREELKTATGYNIYIGNKYDGANIRVYTAYNCPVNNIEISATRASNERATDDNNKILKINAENLRICYASAYVTDINAHIKALKKAHADARKAYEKAREAFSIYNGLTRGKIQRADIYHGLNNYFI